MTQEYIQLLLLAIGRSPVVYLVERLEWCYNYRMKTEDKTEQKIKQIEAIYADYQKQLQELKAEQEAIVLNLIKNLESAKLDKIRKIIASE